MTELIYFAGGGLVPVALIGVPLLLKSNNGSDIIYPLQTIIGQPYFSGIFLLIAGIFFFSNYKAILYIIDTFRLAPLPPKEFLNKILLCLSVGSSFCLIGLVMLDFTHFTLLNSIFYSFFFISLNLFYLLIDITNGWAYYTPSTIYWFIDFFLLFSSIIYLIFNQYSFSCTEISIMNTSAIFGYILTLLMFLRYFLLYFEVKERIIEFVDDEDEEEDY